jgi:hypothetical protein
VAVLLVAVDYWTGDITYTVAPTITLTADDFTESRGAFRTQVSITAENKSPFRRSVEPDWWHTEARIVGAEQLRLDANKPWSLPDSIGRNETNSFRITLYVQSDEPVANAGTVLSVEAVDRIDSAQDSDEPTVLFDTDRLSVGTVPSNPAA